MSQIKKTLYDWCIENERQDILAQWDYNENADVSPSTISYGSHKKVAWICEQGHKWKTSPKVRSMGCGCPFCSRNLAIPGATDLKTLFPHLITEWDFEKNANIRPEFTTASSDKKVWWKCANGHEWQAVINKRTKLNHGCPYCANQYVISGETDFATKYPELVHLWNADKNGDLQPSQVTAKSHKKVWWKCHKGHEWQAAIANIAAGKGCPQCSLEMHSSFPEQAIYYYISKLATCESRKVIFGKEVDIYINDMNTAIEYNGRYYHKNETTKQRDIKKQLCLENHNVRLITVAESNKNIVESDCIQYDIDKGYKYLDWAISELITQIFPHQTDIREMINIKRDEIKIKDNYLFLQKEISISITHPDDAKEWHPSKNGHLTPDMFTHGSHTRIWWLGKCGHEWQASIYTKTKGHGCPVCAGKKLVVGINDLFSTHPELAQEWDYEKNTIDPATVSRGCRERVFWKCNDGHSWQCAIGKRTRDGKSCPTCKKRNKIMDNEFEF